MSNAADKAESAFTDPLDSLLNDAMREGLKRRVIAQPNKPTKRESTGAAINRLQKRWTDPEHWRTVRTITLVHRDGEQLTIIGNFNEMIHDSLTARKLQRVEGPTPTDGTEYVTGRGWLNEEVQRHADYKSWIETRELTVALTLAECGLHCPETLVQVRLEYGGVARVELTAETQFFNGARNTFLFLPKGCDVLQAMTLDSKLDLRNELKLDDGDTNED